MPGYPPQRFWGNWPGLWAWHWDFLKAPQGILIMCRMRCQGEGSLQGERKGQACGSNRCYLLSVPCVPLRAPGWRLLVS